MDDVTDAGAALTDEQHDWATQFSGIKTRPDDLTPPGGGQSTQATDTDPAQGTGPNTAQAADPDPAQAADPNTAPAADPGPTQAADPDPAQSSGQDAPQAPAQQSGPKKITVTIVTSYGQSVRYWIQDRAIDHDNSAAEGAGTVLVDGKEYGPGEHITLSCIEMLKGAYVCYDRESNPAPAVTQRIGWSSDNISDGDTFTIKETGQTP
jgi:hypothetical protein